MKISRESLYERLWSEKFLSVANQLGITRKQLNDICTTNKIPIPPQSYWSIRELGKIIPPIKPLPAHECGLIEITPASTATSQINDEDIKRETELQHKKALKLAQNGKLHLNLDDDQSRWRDLTTTAIKAYPVQKTLRSKKEIILDTIEYFDEEFKPWDKRNSSIHNRYRDRHLAIACSKEQLRPILSIYDSLIDIINALGLTLLCDAKGTRVKIRNFEIKIEVREAQKRVTVSGPEDRYKQTELVPTGQLKLCVGEGYFRKEYQETQFTGIQEKIFPFFKAIFSRYSALLEIEKYWEAARQKQEEEKERQHQAEIERQRIEELKQQKISEVKSVINKAMRFRIYQEVRTLADELKRTGHREEGSNAETIAAMINPISPQCHTQLNEQDIDNIISQYTGNGHN